MEELFIAVMDLQEAKNHQHKLKSKGVVIELRMNDQTCMSGGCKVTVEIWGKVIDKEMLLKHFNSDFLKHVMGHEPNFEHLSQIFDPTLSEVMCQACGAKFSPQQTQCPECGLCY
jgi:hypothetical protein